MTTYKGQCDCGALSWEAKLNEEQAKHILCHCAVCQRQSGGAFTFNQIVPKSQLKFTKGEDTLKTYTYKGDSGNDTHCYFCPTCTVSPYHHQTVQGPDNIVLRTGLLDGAKKFPVAAEIYGKQKFPFETKYAETFDTTPPQ